MNTLVTNFKGEITDESMQRYDILSLEFPANFDGNTEVQLNVAEEKQAKICSDAATEIALINSNGVIFGYTPYTVTHSEYGRYFKAAAGSKLYIEGVRNLTSFIVGQLSGVGIAQLRADSKEISSIFRKSNLTDITVRRQDGIKCNIELLVGTKTEFNDISISDNTASDINGNISCLSNNIGLTKLAVPWTNVSGSIEALADAMVENGRDSGTLYINVEGTTCSGVTDVGKKVDIHFTDDTTTYPRGWYATVHS